MYYTIQKKSCNYAKALNFNQGDVIKFKNISDNFPIDNVQFVNTEGRKKGIGNITPSTEVSIEMIDDDFIDIIYFEVFYQGKQFNTIPVFRELDEPLTINYKDLVSITIPFEHNWITYDADTEKYEDLPFRIIKNSIKYDKESLISYDYSISTARKASFKLDIINYIENKQFINENYLKNTNNPLKELSLWNYYYYDEINDEYKLIETYNNVFNYNIGEYIIDNNKVRRKIDKKELIISGISKDIYQITEINNNNEKTVIYSGFVDKTKTKLKDNIITISLIDTMGIIKIISEKFVTSVPNIVDENNDELGFGTLDLYSKLKTYFNLRNYLILGISPSLIDEVKPTRAYKNALDSIPNYESITLGISRIYDKMFNTLDSQFQDDDKLRFPIKIADIFNNKFDIDIDITGTPGNYTYIGFGSSFNKDYYILSLDQNGNTIISFIYAYYHPDETYYSKYIDVPYYINVVSENLSDPLEDITIKLAASGHIKLLSNHLCGTTPRDRIVTYLVDRINGKATFDEEDNPEEFPHNAVARAISRFISGYPEENIPSHSLGTILFNVNQGYTSINNAASFNNCSGIKNITLEVKESSPFGVMEYKTVETIDIKYTQIIPLYSTSTISMYEILKLYSFFCDTRIRTDNYGMLLFDYNDYYLYYDSEKIIEYTRILKPFTISYAKGQGDPAAYDDIFIGNGALNNIYNRTTSENETSSSERFVENGVLYSFVVPNNNEFNDIKVKTRISITKGAVIDIMLTVTSVERIDDGFFLKITGKGK